MFLFHQTAGQDHRCQCHGNAFALLREHFLCHHRPGRATGGSHKRKLFRYFFDEIFCFFNGTQVSTDRYFHNVCKSKSLECRSDFTRCQLRSELSCHCRCDCRINRCITLNCLYRLENLGFICNSSKWTVCQAHTAGNTFFLINIRTTVFIRTDCIHSAGFCTGSLQFHDCMVRTDADTFSTFDTFFLINHGFSVLKADSTFRTDLFTGMSQTSLAGIRHSYFIIRAGMAGKLNHIDQRRLIIFLRLHTFLSTCGYRCML